jgi:AcrR family transcriptional regulator
MATGTARRVVPDAERKRPKRIWVERDLLHAAADQFERTGYASTTIQSIASAAGLTKGAIYSNFASKLELFAAVAASRSAELTALTLDGLDDTVRIEGRNEQADLVSATVSHVADRLAGILLNEVRWHLLAAEFALVASREADAAQAYATMRTNRIDSIVDIVLELGRVNDLDLTVADARRTARTLIALLNGLAVEVASGMAATRDELREIVARTIRGQLRLPSPSESSQPMDGDDA